MRSGYEHDGWDGEYYQSSLRNIAKFDFQQKTFMPYAGLVSQEGDLRKTVPYTGQDYDELTHTVVPGRWDHEHCYVCGFRIDEGFTYWENSDGLGVCDVCHDYIERTGLGKC